MKKVLLIMAAALMTMTQCRKQETSPATPSANTIKMTITAGSGAKTDITDNGVITWTSGDVLYVSDGTNWLGSLDLVSGVDEARGTFEGTIQGISEGTTPCHFFYLGHDNGMVEPTGTNNAVISFAEQDGSKDDAFKYHLGHGIADVTVSGGEATGEVTKMTTEIAIARLKLKMDGEDYTGSVTMDVSNTMTVSPAGTFSGSGNGIDIGNNGGTSDGRYVTLIPTGTESVDVSFSGSATGSLTFGHGIQANNLYGMAAGIEVTLEAASAPKFSVGENTTVEFAPGNLYWDGSAFHFETSQWGTQPASDDSWNENHVSHFFWSNTTDWQTSGKEPYASSYSYSTQTMSDVFFTEAEGFTVDGETAGTWRTLSNAEWNYLLNTRNNASSLRAWVTLTDVGASGLVILPDNSTTTASSVTTKDAIASSGAVFLPASGDRGGTNVGNVGSYGYYWSSTPYDWFLNNLAYGRRFYSDDSASTSISPSRNYGYAVRLVR